VPFDIMGIRIPTLQQDNVAIRCRGCSGLIEGTPFRVNVMDVPPEEAGRYGVIGGTRVDGHDGRLWKIDRVVEKPASGEAPSSMAIIGRYVLTPKIFDKLEQTQRGAGGEIQLTDAIEALMEEQPVYGYAFEGTRYVPPSARPGHLRSVRLRGTHREVPMEHCQPSPWGCVNGQRFCPG